jgi:hypothetical protein
MLSKLSHPPPPFTLSFLKASFLSKPIHGGNSQMCIYKYFNGHLANGLSSDAWNIHVWLSTFQLIKMESILNYSLFSVSLKQNSFIKIQFFNPCNEYLRTCLRSLL